MIDFGIVKPGTTLNIPFSTYDSNDPSASVTLTGLAVTDIEIFKDGSATTRSSDNGYALLDTDGIDFAGITGAHGFSVNLADNSVAGFYAAGSQYWVIVASVTVDGATINFRAATFRIGYPQALINTTIATLASQTSFTLTAGPAEDDALNGMEVVIHDVASAVQIGRAVILDYTGSTKTVTLAAGTTFTAAATDNIAIMGPSPLQPTVMGRTLDVSSGGEAGMDWANIGGATTTVNLSGTTIKTATDVETDTAEIGAAGAGLTNINLPNQTMDIVGNITGNLSGSVGSVSGAVGSVTGAVGSVTAAVTLPTIPADWITASGIAANAIGASELATDAVAEIADAVWDEAIAGHAGAGSTGEALSAAGSAGDPWSTALPGAYSSGQAGKIIGDNINATISSRASQTSVDDVPTNAELATALGTADDAVLAAIAALNNLSQANIRTAVGLGSANLDTQLDALPTAAENAAAALTTQMTEAYAANGVAPTLAQALFAVHQMLMQFVIAGTTITVKKLDNSTTAFEVELDDDTAPTSAERA